MPVGIETGSEIKTQAEICYGKELEKLPLSEINYFPEAQTRLVYADETELGNSIRENDLLHAPLVAEFEPDEAAENLTVLNQLWGSDYRFEDLTPNEKGNYFFLIAGHRRILGINTIEHEGTPTIYVMSNMRRHITIDDALALQITENTHQGLPPEREAAVIVVWHRRNQQYTKAQCAQKLGISEDKVRKAWRFSELPQSIQSLAGVALPYARVLQLHPLMRAYQGAVTAEGEFRYSAEDTEALVYKAAALCQANRWSRSKLNDYIANVITDTKLVDDNAQEALFEMKFETHSERAELERVLRGMGTIAGSDVYVVANALLHQLADREMVLDEISSANWRRLGRTMQDLAVRIEQMTGEQTSRAQDELTLLTAS